MDPRLLSELLRFAGQHQFLTISLFAMTCVVVVNVVSYSRGKMKLQTLHKRPYEYLGYLGTIAGFITAINHFLEGACK